MGDEYSEQVMIQRSLKAAGLLGCWTYDVASDRFFAAEGINAVFGITARADLGAPAGDYRRAILPSHGARVSEERHGGIRPGSPFYVEYDILAAGGQRRSLQSIGHYEAVNDGGRLVANGIILDVTDRRAERDVVADVASRPGPSGPLQDRFNAFAEHYSRALDVVETLPLKSLHRLLEPVTFEVVRVLGWYDRIATERQQRRKEPPRQDA